jgi:hypothetical protein
VTIGFICHSVREPTSDDAEEGAAEGSDSRLGVDG